jgi:hypothetical protein
MNSAFYNSDPIPSGLGWLVYPVRRLIRRIQRPYYFKLQSMIDQMTAQLDQACQQVHEVQKDLSQVRLELQHERDQNRQQVRALSWDHIAVVRRMAAVEDQVVTAVSAEDASLLPRLLASPFRQSLD